MSYDFVFNRMVFLIVRVQIAITLVLLMAAVSYAGEGGAGLSATGKVDEAVSPEVRAYLQLQEQLHATQMALDRNQKQSTESAIETTEALTTGMKATSELSARLKALEESLSAQKSREWDVMQSSNRTMLIVAGAFASFGFVALFMLGYFQWRTINRLAEISAVLPRPGLSLPRQRPWAALTAGESVVPAPVPSAADNSDLLQTLARLEQRIRELEQGIVSGSEEKNAEALPKSESNGDSNGIPDLEHTNGNGSETPAATTPPESDLVSVLLGKGQSLLNVEKPEEALECFEQALDIEPANPEALVKKGAALEKLRKLSEAIECYDRAIASDSTMTIAYLYKGGLCNRMERFNEALQCYEQALRTQEKRAV